ncbi:putative proton-dependent oligopeptide transporter family, MFS transporter superfamily [Helianthus anomalus]
MLEKDQWLQNFYKLGLFEGIFKVGIIISQQDPKDITPDEVTSNPWRLCMEERVKELKSLIRILPVCNPSKNHRHLGSSHFQIPAASFSFFALIILPLWVLVYDRVIIPSASKITRKPVHLNVKLRIGMGFAFSTLAMAVSTIVEHVRRRKAIQQGFRDNAHTVINMSAMWLVPQYCLHGLAEALSIIGQNEFYYSELPKTISSIAASLFLLGLAVANLLARWIATNINQGHYDRYYWVLVVISFINLLYFLVCCWAYGPCVNEKVKDECIQESNEHM